MEKSNFKIKNALPDEAPGQPFIGIIFTDSLINVYPRPLMFFLWVRHNKACIFPANKLDNVMVLIECGMGFR